MYETRTFEVSDRNLRSEVVDARTPVDALRAVPTAGYARELRPCLAMSGPLEELLYVSMTDRSWLLLLPNGQVVTAIVAETARYALRQARRWRGDRLVERRRMPDMQGPMQEVGVPQRRRARIRR